MKITTKFQLGLFALGLAAALPVAYCQDAPPPDAPAGDEGGPPPPRRPNPRAMMERMKKVLNLTADQVTQIRTIYKDQMKQMRALRDDDNLSDEDRRAKMKEIGDASRAKIRALLTPDQQMKFDKMPPMGGRRRGHGPNGEGPPPPPPS